LGTKPGNEVFALRIVSGTHGACEITLVPHDWRIFENLSCYRIRNSVVFGSFGTSFAQSSHETPFLPISASMAGKLIHAAHFL
jgi:hypothetical protein